MVFDLFGSLRSITKLDQVCIDNNAFRLHYKATVILLVASSILVTGRQYFGDPIDCIQRDDIPQNVMDTFCWIHSTFTLPNALSKQVGVDVIAPGVDNYKPGEKKVYHKYYQWVCFVLFIQAMFFYVPRYLWKIWEGGRLRSLVLGLNNPILGSGERSEQIALLTHYLKTNLRYHDSYFYYFVFCEILNFLNVIFQMYLVDAFLGGAFSTYGLEVLRYSEMDPEERIDPMVKVFPRVTKCTFHRYGSSGDVQKHDSLCILPLNIINEKIYIFLWFWFVILAVVSGWVIIERMIIIFFPHFRYLYLRSAARIADRNHLREVLDHARIGDWFILHLLAKNLDSLHFRELVKELRSSLSEEGEKFRPRDTSETGFSSKLA
ncbi:innexin inx2-like [Panonychus citri]|uniref:innexin inx2-like n=1 Tax=Panonychus citri TaxID=50023 RepID=UPI002307C408|nr:innexin inx2-like [Panonychus citri]XP_053204826.1 innexin inx2-like [Panonychus citri]XP_053204833.1 innexin inx2-like [Panonychus citri]